MKGVTSAKVKLVTDRSGMSINHEIDADVVVAPGAAIPDQTALVEQILRIAWSANEVLPDQGVYLNLVTDPQIEVGPAIYSAGWRPSAYTAGDASRVLVSGRALEEHVGKWPGPVPETRPDLIG
jgi:hypothetical protein